MGATYRATTGARCQQLLIFCGNISLVGFRVYPPCGL
uniref:Uncharacterized protein n=1 Tax=Arundo donax TaxID=35708 RepID=A0A0A9HIM3_ARUDO